MKYWVGFIECSKTHRRGWCITLGWDRADGLENAKAVFRANGYDNGEVDVWHIGKAIGFYQELPHLVSDND